MSQATIGTQVHQALDVHLNFAPKITFHLAVIVDGGADRAHLIIVEVLCTDRAIYTRALKDILGGVPADSKNVGQRDVDSLPPGKVDTRNASHGDPPVSLPLTLLMPRVLADHAHDATPPNNLAFLTSFLHRRFDLHHAPLGSTPRVNTHTQGGVT
jgi:hypothetical protein